MSAIEINSKNGGMNYGGLRHDAMLGKLEETDPKLLPRRRATFDTDGFDDPSLYETHARGEILDWGPDAPYLESDAARRDPSVSRSAINLRYNGTRGSRPELPRHPELFIGFVGNDPRGVANDPRFEQVRTHMAARANRLQVTMGNNNADVEAERPWVASTISYAKKEIQRRTKAMTKIFTRQKEGRPQGRNIANPAASQHGANFARREAVDERHNEGFAHNRAVAVDRAGQSARSGFGGAGERGIGSVATMQLGDTDLAVQRYNVVASGKRLVEARTGEGGAPTQDWTASRVAENRVTLAQTVASAAAAQAVAKAGAHDQPTRDAAVSRMTPAGASPSDVARAYRLQQSQQSIQTHLSNAASISRALKTGDPSAIRKVAGQAVADGVRGQAVEGLSANKRGTAQKDAANAARQIEAAVVGAAAAGRETASYRSLASVGDTRTALSEAQYEAAQMGQSRLTQDLGKAAEAGRWRSATQGQHEQGYDGYFEAGANGSRATDTAVEIGGKGGIKAGATRVRPSGESLNEGFGAEF